MQVAGAGGIQENCPGDIAVLLFLVFQLPLIPQKAAVDDEILKQPVPHSGINVFGQAHR